MSLRPTLGTALLIVGLPLAAAGQNAPSFDGIGDLAGGGAESAALAVSADASTVVGYSDGASGIEAVRWTAAGGLQGLGQPASGDPFSEATGVSADGSVIVGTAVGDDGGRAFRWTSAGHVFLGTYFCSLCDPATTGEGVSADGSTVVGSGLQAGFLQTPRVQASRWAGGGTAISDLGDLPGGGTAAVALGASANGALIVGEADSGAGPSGFFWSAGSMQAPPGLPGALYRTGALAVSDDGSTLAGYANSSPTGTGLLVPVRWTGLGFATIEALGALPGQTSARGRAFDASPDGSLVVGTTRDSEGRDVAFLWSEADGMRALRDVLADAYGVEIGAWQLHEARGISDVDAFGQFTVVGLGTNPAGQPEGFVAVLSPTACNDGVDGDGDGLVDHPDDPGCTAPGDRSEGPDCADGLDNDGDALVDGLDPECTGSLDGSELADCGNGLDDDGDGLTDFPDDPGCRSPTAQRESPECDDGVDNDADGAVDGADDECFDASDTSERLDCQDGVDNDGDLLVDAADPDCTGSADPSEDPACSDFEDNDGDGRLDHPAAYPRCRAPDDASEGPECANGVDDDGDGDVDFPADAGCAGPLFDVEAPASPAPGDLLVVDRGAGALWAIDPDTGSEQLLSLGAALVQPEGIAVRGDGRVSVATPGGLLEVETRTGRQDPRSLPFSSAGGLPLAFDASGDPVVLDATGIYRVVWNPAGVGASLPLLSVPVGTDLGAFTGFTLVLEDDETALTTGFGLLGDGVFRADLSAGTVTKVTPGFQTHAWRDLALEAPGTLLAVGWHSPLGEGVFRIDLASGAVTALSTDPAWQRPDAVAVGAGGDVYVADSGTCGADACTGGLVARVDPASGARSVLRQGLFSGALVLAIAGDPPPACDDGLDDDGDGLTDFPDDPGCRDALSALEAPQCDDGVDNDGDGGVDWDGGPDGGAADPQCSVAYRNTERPTRRCGVGFELALIVPLLARLRRWRR